MRIFLALLLACFVARAANPSFTVNPANRTNTLPRWTTPSNVGESRVLDTGVIMSIGYASNAPVVLTGITNSTDVIGIGDFALDSLVTDGSQNIYGYGVSALAGTTLAPFSGQIFAYGESALSGANITNAVHIYGYGESVGTSMTGDGFDNLYLFGNSVLASGAVNNSSGNIYAIGNEVLSGASIDSSQLIYAFGNQALQSSNITNSESIVAIGSRAAQSMTGNSLIGIYAIGEDALGNGFFSDGGTYIFGIGHNALAAATITNSTEIYGLGSDVLNAAAIDASAQVFAIGVQALFQARIVNGSSDIYAIGPTAGEDAVFDDASSIFMLGESAMANAVITNSSSGIVAIGVSSLSGSRINSSSDIYAIGANAGASIGLTNKNHIFILGSGGTATNNNDFVFGDANYNYFFPGASARFAALPTVNGVPVLTNAASGGVANIWTPNRTLSFVTTNVTIPLNGGTNFVITLTNGSPGFFTYSGAPATTQTNTTFTLTVIQDATGTRVMNWNTNFYFQGAFVPAVTTNALAEDVFTLTTSARVAGAVNVTWNPNFSR